MKTIESSKRRPTETPLDAAQIDWASLEHAYGDASDVPGNLAALSSPDAAVRAAGLRALRLSVYHQGWAGYSAAPHVPAFLIRALQDEATPDKVGIANLLALLSEPHRTFAHDLMETLFVATGWLRECMNEDERAIARHAYDEVRKGYPVYTKMLSASSAAERAAAAHLCALSWEDAAASFAQLFAHGTAERDPTAAASMMLGAGLARWILKKQGAKVADEGARTWFSAGLASESALLRTSAAIALCYLGTPPANALAALRQSFRSLDRQPQFLWFGGDVANGALDVLARLHLNEECNALPALCEILEEKLQALRHMRIETRRRGVGADLGRVAQVCVNLAFLQRKARQWPRAFTPPQRLVLGLLARYPYFMRFERASFLSDMGLAGDDFQRACGVVPATLLGETRWVGTRAPEEKTLREWLLAGAASHRLAGPLAQSLTAREGFSLIEEALADNSDLDSPEALTFYEHLGLALLKQPGATAILHEQLRLMVEKGPLARGQEVSSYQAIQVFSWLSAQPQAEVGVELIEALLLRRANYWFFTALARFRPALLRLPRERRERVLRKLRGHGHQEPGEPWALYDVCPSPGSATRLLRLMRRWESFFLDQGAAQVILVLAAHVEVAAEVLLAAQRDERRKDRHLIAAAIARGKRRR